MFPVPSLPSAAGRPGGRRGFTLIELAVVMAVVGLLLGASLMTTRALDERRQLQAEMRRLETVRDAIVGYALRHRTRARVIHFYGFQRFVNRAYYLRAFRLPAGRPYLPCPDWDGDGFEDRYPEAVFRRGVEVRPDLTVSVTISNWAIPHDSLSWGGGITRPYGSCLVERGAAPWRTLGVEPSDSWGNRHTYFADQAFASAIFGFDHGTIADVYDPHMPRAPGYRRAVRNYSSPTFADMCPAVVCDGARTVGDCDQYMGTNPGTAGQCSWNMNLPNRVLKAGAVAETEITSASFDGKRFPTGGITDGLPFVLVSHGSNGRFAVNHWATLGNPVNALGETGPVCNIGERVTGAPVDEDRFARVPIGNPSLLHEAANGARRAPGGRCKQLFRADGSSGFNSSFFAWEPPGASDGGGFDDLLLWSTRDELMLAFPESIPRLPPMTVPYFPNLR